MFFNNGHLEWVKWYFIVVLICMPLLGWGSFYYAQYLESFYQSKCWIIAKCFFGIYWCDHMVLTLQFVTVYLMDWFSTTEECLRIWDKPHVIMTFDSFKVLMDFFARILLRMFTSVHLCDIGLYLSFPLLSWCWYHGDDDLIGWVCGFPVYCGILEEFQNCMF